MPISQRLHYYRRIFSAYLTPGASQLTFWHDTPKENLGAPVDRLGEYYMDFSRKAEYGAHLDPAGIPMLDYRGDLGLQYNPIAISQWGLGNYNLFRESPQQDTGRINAGHRSRFLAAGDWLCSHLQENSHGLWVWNHHFDWEYRDRLKAPWYSGLAQGQGISLLVRAHLETGNAKYMKAAEDAFETFLKSVDEGGIVFIDDQGNKWFEEYIVSPPTHILNGFIWAAWGVRDFFLATRNARASQLFDQAVQTLRTNLHRYDVGFWSLYEQSGTRLPMLASPFYHRLHIIQLRIMYRLTGESLFNEWAERWQAYSAQWLNRTRAVCYKSMFKLCYY